MRIWKSIVQNNKKNFQFTINMTNFSKSFPVRILKDCRDDEEYGRAGNLDRAYGICTGLSGPHERCRDSPKIETIYGDIIYGIECWWVPANIADKLTPNELRETLELYLERINRQAADDLSQRLDPPVTLDLRAN